MPDQRTALYIDFDNVFGGLLKLDPGAAVSFAERPGVWLDALSERFLIDGPRRWLVRRCYMNPAGSVANPRPSDSTPRLYFSKFRPFFTKAGFEVIDCPALTTRYKNAADIRMVLDAVDALTSETRYDEFVVASADSDLTPLLVRLRAADRRTTIMSPSDAAVAFVAIADRLVDGAQVLELLSPDDLPQEQTDVENDVAQVAEPLTKVPVGTSTQEFAEFIRARYVAASEPLNLTTLAHEARAEFGPSALESHWFGGGSFGKAVAAIDLPEAEVSGHYLWDASRHQHPQDTSLPDPVARVCAITDVPKLPQDRWPHVYRILADYAPTHTFALSEATKWSRDQAREQGVELARSVFNFVARGAAFGGAPLHRKPSPSAEEIGVAFVSNVLNQARAAQVGLSAEEERVVADWLGAPNADPDR